MTAAVKESWTSAVVTLMHRCSLFSLFMLYLSPVSSTLSPSPTPTCESPAPTDSLCDKPTSSLVVPVSAAGGGLVLLLLILVALALLCLIYRRRRDKKSYRFGAFSFHRFCVNRNPYVPVNSDLSHLTVDVMKEPPPPTIPPSDFVHDGVTYTHVMHDEEV